MSEIGLNINIDSYNNEGIKTIKGNNNAEIYKLYILKNKRRLSLVGKTVKLGYVMAGTTKGDIIENLNITNAEQGEITFPITNRISKKDGVYSCQLAIYGADEFLEYTATFGLTVEDNIFTKIAGEIENSKDLTYIERILEEAKTVSGDLKTNIPVATNLNSSLESNISNARNINTTLADTTEKSKVAATDAIEKKSQLESSIVEAKKFIDGLDGSQNIPGIRMELTELQNGLKSNQALAYQGNYINAENTLEGRTEGMRISGRTLVNLVKYRLNNQKVGNPSLSATLCTNEMFKINTTYTIIYTINSIESGTGKTTLNFSGGMSAPDIILNSSNLVGTHKQTFTLSTMPSVTHRNVSLYHLDRGTVKLFSDVLIIEGEVDFVPNYFEGLKSFGEAEQEGDKYKISILSRNKNLFNLSKFEDNTIYYQDTGIKGNLNQYKAMRIKTTPNKSYFFTNPNVGTTVQCVAYKNGVRISGGYNWRGMLTKDCDEYAFSFLKTEILSNDFQFEEGTIATSYELYKEDKKDILIKKPLREGDYLYEDNEQVKVYRDGGKYIFTGNENMYIEETIAANNIKFVITTEGTDIKPAGKVICNKFIQGNDTIANSVRLGTSNKVVINIQSSTLESPNMGGFRKWLKDNPTEIIYQLATPTVEVVENCVDIDLDTYQEKTYFNILNSLPGTLDFKVPSNIGSLVQSNAKEINNIWDTINNLLVPSIVKANGNLAMLKLNNNLN